MTLMQPGQLQVRSLSGYVFKWLLTVIVERPGCRI